MRTFFDAAKAEARGDLQRLLAEGRPLVLETALEHRDGSYGPVLMTGTPLSRSSGGDLDAFLLTASEILDVAQMSAASVTVGNGIELRVITAAIIGGASLNGGEGSVFGAFLGALFMGVLANALNLLGVDVYWQNLVTGLILIIAVVIDVINERRKTGRM